jgi:two-component system, chemotaxis family, chemotaxis protein CheY
MEACLNSTSSVVLLVDDNSLALAFMATSLKELGCSVLSAGNGQEALAILHSGPSVDLVVTDLQMPVMDGLELLRRIRASETLKHLPVILCSGDMEEAMMNRAAEYGCACYLIKPVFPDVLFEQIVTALERAAAA